MHHTLLKRLSHIAHHRLAVQHLKRLQTARHVLPIVVRLHRLHARIVAEQQILQRTETSQLVHLRKVSDIIVPDVKHLEPLHHLDALQAIDLIVTDPELFEVFRQ